MLELLTSLIVLQAENGEELPIDPDTLVLLSLGMTAVLLVIGIAVGYWVYKDASKRGNNAIIWALVIGGLIFLFFPLGIVAVIAYVFLRGDKDKTSSEPDSAQPESAGQDW